MNKQPKRRRGKSMSRKTQKRIQAISITAGAVDIEVLEKRLEKQINKGANK